MLPLRLAWFIILSPAAAWEVFFQFRKTKKLIAESGLFDRNFYLATNQDVAAHEIDPLDHYLIYGAAEGRSPGPGFDPAAYARKVPNARHRGLNPLLHYLRHGQYQGVEISPPRQVEVFAPPPPPQDWLAAGCRQAAGDSGDALVNIVVPVYGGGSVTLACLYSVLMSPVETPFVLTVVDDRGPDKRLSKELDLLAAEGMIHLIRNEKNLGFPASVNRGMALYQDLDQLVLNSDTRVFGDWLDRLRAAANATNDIGTATPLTNNGTICSYPTTGADNIVPLEISWEEVDRIAAAVNRGTVVDIPTAVGFCMYVKAACLQQIGPLDAQRFGKGYGEENDFCMRAAECGWRHVAATDVFVHHLGRMSFGNTHAQHIRRSSLVLENLHPSYFPLVARHIRQDPLRAARVHMDVERLRRTLNPTSMLFITHRLGGGTEKHVQEMTQRIETNGINVLVMRPSGGSQRRVDIEHYATIGTPNMLGLDFLAHSDVIESTMRSLGIAHIHVHHYAGFDRLMPDWIRAFCEALGLQYDFTLHDYLTFCPRINLVDESGFYCGEPDLPVCERCASTLEAFYDRDTSMHDLVERSRRFLFSARRVFSPSVDAASRLQRHFPGLRVTIAPHEDRLCHAPILKRRRRSFDVRTVGVIGAISQCKGSMVLANCCRDIEARRLPLKFILYGYADIDLRSFAAIRVTGAYEEQRLPHLLKELPCDMVFFPAVWPETFSYTLSEAKDASLYPVSFDIGAIAERIRAYGWGHLIPFELACRPGDINDRLITMSIPKQARSFPLTTAQRPEADFISNYYELHFSAKSI